MGKEMEELKKILSFAFVMSENMVGLSKGDYDEKYFVKKTYEYLQKYVGNFEYRDILKNAITEYEEIKNAKANEALKCLKKLDNASYYFGNLASVDKAEEVADYFNTIKQALIKYNEIEKKLECPLEVFMKLHKANGVYCEIEIALSSLPSKTVYLEIDRLGLDGIHFKPNEYDLRFIEYRYYKECFWIETNRSE